MIRISNVGIVRNFWKREGLKIQETSIRIPGINSLRI